METPITMTATEHTLSGISPVDLGSERLRAARGRIEDLEEELKQLRDENGMLRSVLELRTQLDQEIEQAEAWRRSRSLWARFVAFFWVQS
jgi:cell shape-determining protein MreC